MRRKVGCLSDLEKPLVGVVGEAAGLAGGRVAGSQRCFAGSRGGFGFGFCLLPLFLVVLGGEDAAQEGGDDAEQEADAEAATEAHVGYSLLRPRTCSARWMPETTP